MTETAPSRPPPDSPESLLESHIAGDDGAFGKLTARYGTQLFSFLERMTGDARQAEDAFQQTFVNAAKNARSFDRRESSFSVRLYRIANAALDEVRRRTRRSEEFAGEGAVANALGRIPGGQREAFLLKEEGDLPFGEIGAVLGCGRETAKSRFRLAVNALAPLLGLENAGQTGQRDGDRNLKDSGHLPDPLDYLYEELPPDQMLEARKHLAACSSCRADMRAVREMVKTYRQAGKPAVPAGLAARAVRVALEEAKNEKARKTAAPLPAIPPAAQAQIPPPAPAATAQIPPAHTPPAQPNPVPPHPPSASSPPSPPPPPNMSGMRGVNSWDQPDPIDLDREFARLKEEVLREIPKGWRTWLFHPAWTVAASVIFICAVLIHLSPRLNRTETRCISSAPAPAIRDDAARDGDVARRIRDRERLPSSRPREQDDAVPATPVPAPILETAAVMSETIPDIPPASEPESEPASASAPGPAPESMSEPEPAVEPPVESAVEPADRAVVEPAAEPAVKPLPASAIPAAPAEEERDAVFAAPVPPPEVRLPRPAPAPELPVGATPPELLESLGEKTKALAESEEPGVVIWENPDAASVPQLIERPPAYDPAERIQSLAILAGMQMASGEFVDAWQTVGLLENYDPAAAEALGATLRDLEQAAKAKAEEEAREIAPPVVEPEPESEPKAIPEPEPEIISEPEPAPASEPEPAIDPGPVFELNPVPESALVFESAPAAVYAPMVPVMIIPAPTPRARPAAPARPFTTDPYFRDY